VRFESDPGGNVRFGAGEEAAGLYIPLRPEEAKIF
jgi:hypothetical protein